VPSTLDRVRDIVCHDLDSAFIRTFAISVAWGYDRIYEELAEDTSLCDIARNEEFVRRRGLNATSSLAQSAEIHGVPFEWKRLDCNGQSKLLVKAGRLILIQEPMASLVEHPRASDYKKNLAESNSLTLQYGLDLGDRPLHIRDWSGCVLGVLLHGCSGPKFTREHKGLGGLMLGVPDVAYENWTLRLDLHRIAMFGIDDVPLATPASSGCASPAVQSDDVKVTLKPKRGARGEAG
jgi:hypothetical protein